VPASSHLLSTTTVHEYKHRFGVYLPWRSLKGSGLASFLLVNELSFSDVQALIDPLLDGGSSGLPALYTVDEILSRLAFDIKSNEELMPWRHFELMIGTGPGG
jgi:hypothetical protein